MKDAIRIVGARQHNLKGIDLEIPRRALTVLTGPSGSGKSSLAFDTVYAEGQRRYIESLSTYAKQFLERMEKPAVDGIDGVSPSVAIDQKNQVKTSRSTVGTVTEVYDYVRLLWARVGRTFCPECDEEVVPDTVQSAAERVLAWPEGSRIQLAFPLRLSEEIGHEVAVSNLRAQGYVRVLADGRELYLPELEPKEEGDVEEGAPGPGAAVDLAAAEDVLVVVDRLRVDPEDRERLVDSLAAAFAEGDGQAVVLRMGDPDETRPRAQQADAEATGVEATEESTAPRVAERRAFTEAFRCSTCGREFPEPRPSLFTFNSPTGACPKCTGFGATLEYDEELIVPDPGRSLADGAVDPWSKPRYRRERERLRAFAERLDVDMRRPWRELPEEVRHEILYGADGFQGAFPFLVSKERKRYKRYIRVFLRQYQTPRTCDRCGGDRLRSEALNVRVGGRTIAEAARRPIRELREWLEELELAPFERKVAALVLEELRDRLRFLDEVGLGYLTLDRQARSLAGG